MNRKLRWDRVSLAAGGILTAAAAVIYLGGCIYYSGRFLANTAINEIDVSGLTAEEAEQKIAERITGHSLELVFRDGSSESIRSDTAGVTYQKNFSLQEEYKSQNHWTWFMAYFNDTNLEKDDAVSIDENRMKTAVNSLEHMSKDSQKKPVNASVMYRNEKFEIQKEDRGSLIDDKKLIRSISQAFLDLRDNLDLEKEKVYVEPSLTSESPSLKSKLDAANRYARASITYETRNGKITLDGEDIIKWLSYDSKKEEYYKDDANFKKEAKAFIKKIAWNFSTSGGTRTFTGANGKKHTVSGGSFGKAMNQEKEAEALLRDIADHKTAVRTPDLTGGPQKTDANGGLGNTFVEVDLGNQKVYYHENGKVIMQSSCVSGKATDPDRKTPAGTYYIYFMQRNRVLRGTKLPNGKWPYETPVKYWMAFNGGIGLHDADFRSSFGGNIYINNGSHGCINLPVSFAGKLYSKLKVNTPVVCYY